MIAATARNQRRSGITLTEILIAILIMGVGLISLATLFPLGLLRLREGTRQSRAATTFESAQDDLDARQLLFLPTFRNTWYGLRNPFSQDTLADLSYYTGSLTNSTAVGNGALASGSNSLPANSVGLGTGLPICYDPLWRAVTGVFPPLPPQPGVSAYIGTTLFDTTLDFANSYGSPTNPQAEARFGSGIFGGTSPFSPYVHADPDGGLPSAHGLQRLTNFIPWSSAGLTTQYGFTSTNFALGAASQPADVAGNVFTSIDDIVFNPLEGGATAPSSLLPDMSSGGPQADYRFTWFFTGSALSPTGDGAQFIGNIVVCDGRPFGFDPLPNQNAYAPAGETVVEGIYGVGQGASIAPLYSGATVGYAVNDKSVKLRWSDTLADPQIRVGGWIADVTYERSGTTYRSRVLTTGSSFARCNWYQIVKRVDPTPDAIAGYRSTVVTLGTPLKSKTLLTISTGNPVHVNTALIMPSVINVFSRSFEVH